MSSNITEWALSITLNLIQMYINVYLFINKKNVRRNISVTVLYLFCHVYILKKVVIDQNFISLSGVL